MLRLWLAAWVPLRFWLEWGITSAGMLWLCIALGISRNLSGNVILPLMAAALILPFLLFGYLARQREKDLYKKEPRTNGTRMAASIGAISPFVAMLVIALPNYTRFQPKARQSEGKIALAAIYGAELEHYKKHGRFAASAKEAGYEPEGSRRLYTLAVAPQCGGDAGFALVPAINSPFLEGREAEVRAYIASLAGLPCDRAENGFTAYAVGVIRKDGALDVWRIDNEKRLVNLSDGTRKKGSWIFW